MKLFRYRKPSLRTLLGVTKVIRSVKRVTGISTIQRYTVPSRIKQRALQKAKIYSPAMTPIRQTAKGNFPTFLGLFRSKKP